MHTNKNLLRHYDVMLNRSNTVSRHELNNRQAVLRFAKTKPSLEVLMTALVYTNTVFIWTAGVPDAGLPDGPEAVPSGHPDLPPHHRQLRLGSQRPRLLVEGGANNYNNDN